MQFNSDQLRTFVAVVDLGSFDRAAAALGITPSAVSQRMRALEDSVGRVLVTRARPTQPTESGETLLRYARQMQSLLEDTARALGKAIEDEPAEIGLTAHPDSLSSWLLPALASLTPTTYRVTLDELDDAHDLREARVSLAVTRSDVVIQGCRSELLGSMRYHPAAASQFIAQWFPSGMTPDAVARAPYVSRLNAALPARSGAARHGRITPVSFVPSAADAVKAVAAGLGWAMLPDVLIEGSSIEIADRDRTSDVPLYLSFWSGEATRLLPTVTVIREAARSALQSR